MFLENDLASLIFFPHDKAKKIKDYNTPMT